MKWSIKPRARRSDPETSHLAAESVYRPSVTALHVFELLVERDMSDEDLVEEYQRRQKSSRTLPPASPSGIRSRRSELVRAGFVEQIGTGLTESRRKCAIWGVVDLMKQPSREA